MGKQAGFFGRQDEAGQVFLAEELQERAKGGGAAGDAGGAAPLTSHLPGHKVLNGRAGEGTPEGAQVAAVGEDRIAAEAAFDLQIAEKLVDLFLHGPY